jgi:membrane-associated protein
LPGDSLLFTAGFLASGPDSLLDKGLPHLNLPLLLIGTLIAAIAGDQVGYLFGSRVGPALFNRPNSRFFKREYVEKAQSYFDRYGAKTIVLARFVPIVRTFAPIAAGVGRMPKRRYTLYNLIGAIAWGFGITFLGFLLGGIPPVRDFVENYIDVILLAAVVLSLGPTALHLLSNRRKAKRAARDQPATD